MTRLKAWIRMVFGFSRSETRGFIILLPLMFVIIFSEPIYQSWYTSRKPDYSQDWKKLDSLVATLKWDAPADSAKQFREEKTMSIPKRSFQFDPNTATLNDLLSLGISQRTAKGIINYRNKGGHFNIKSDLKKMYGLDTATYQELVPYIMLPDARKSTSAKTQNSNSQLSTVAPATFDINSADSTQLKTIPGIGPGLARRIILFRHKLGGFVSFDQLYEVWGLDSTVARKLIDRSQIAGDFLPVRLSVNKATEQELSSHPYLKSKLGKAITVYRFQHGQFATLEDLQKISLIDGKTFLKIKPYLTIE